jgi:hypothetical protein
MVQTGESERVLSQGTLHNGSSRLDYYITVPAPTQWIAVGVVMESEFDNRRRPRRMVVGEGHDEGSAIQDLSRRFDEICRGLRDFRRKTKAASQATSVGNEEDNSATAQFSGWMDDSHIPGEREIQH